ncbi:MAG: hypothetical protein ACOYL6_11645 [Bacteriovoracaceae bacterium]
MGKEILKITYIGKDATFFLKLQESLRAKYPSLDYSFTNLSSEPKDNIHSLITQIAPDNNVIIVDISVHALELLQLCRVIKRTNSLKHTLLMGLFDQQIDENVMKECVVTGIKINHLKTSDNSDFLYDFFSAIMPDKAVALDYVVAEVAEEVEAKEYLKGGYITIENLHAEGDVELKVDDEIKIYSFLTDSKIITSPVMKVKKVTTENVFYNFTYAYDLAFKYVDLDELSDSERYVEAVESAKYRLSKWLGAKSDMSEEKKTRLFLIDRNLSIYKENIKIDAYPFMIRCQPYLLNTKVELYRNNPQIILVGLDGPEIGGKTNQIKNDLNTLKNIVSVIKEREKYEPYLVIFNTTEEKEELKRLLSYDKIMTITGEVTGESLIKMAQLFEARWQKNIETKHTGINIAQAKKQVFLSKENPLSMLEMSRKLYLKTISESEVTFNADFQPLMFGVYRIKEPFNIFITVVPQLAKPDASAGAFRAVIHGIGEEEKEKLRQFINAVYFRALEEKKQEEREAADKIKEIYNAKKTDQLKKEAEKLQDSSPEKKGA